MVDLHTPPPSAASVRNGRLICMVGLPCSGKSSVARELGTLLGVTTFREPEEEFWAECVTRRDLSGRFGAHTWFRSTRTCQLYQAEQLANQGNTVLVDSYLDKLLYFCLGKRGMDWLLHPDDPYFDIARNLAHIDLDTLPLADCIIFFDLEYQTWHQLLQTRSRKIESGLFNDDVFYMQDYLRSGIEFLKNTHGVATVTIKNNFGSPKETAERLKKILAHDTFASSHHCACLGDAREKKERDADESLL